VSSESDRAWRKTCILFSCVKAIAEGLKVPILSGAVINDDHRNLIKREVKIFLASMHELDEKLQIHDLPEQEKENREEEVQLLLRRSYLLLACAFVASKVRDITSEAQKLGFDKIERSAPTIAPLLIVFISIFLLLTVMDSTLIAFFGKKMQVLLAPSFSLNCMATFNTVVVFAVSCLAGISVYRNFVKEGRLRTHSQQIIGFFVIGIGAYAAGWALLFMLLFPISLHSQLDNLVAFCTFRALPPAVGAVLVCKWLMGGGGVWKQATFAALIVGGICAFASFLLAAQAQSEHVFLRTAFDAGQGLIVGFSLGLLAEITRDYGEISGSALVS
jgi:hypothetical protein